MSHVCSSALDCLFFSQVRFEQWAALEEKLVEMRSYGDLFSLKVLQVVYGLGLCSNECVLWKKCASCDDDGDEEVDD